MKIHVLKAFAVIGVLSLIVGSVAWAQGAPRARITGQVASADGEGLPGVTVTFESPSLQGTQVMITGVGGNYASPPLPPGEYTVTFELSGFQPVAQRVLAGATQTVSLDMTLERVDIREEITVSGEAVETISETTTTSTTITYDELEELPGNRDITAAVQLAAGATQGVSGFQISGAMAYDNLYTIDGVVLNENIRGQPFDLFVEDAIQENAIITGGASAEYGRFSGGVVTTVTRSGGNEFAGSFRTNLENDDWQDDNRFSPDERDDEIKESFEAVVDGRIVRDRLWFFATGRRFDDPGTVNTTDLLNIPFTSGSEEDRFGGKLTAALTPSHQLQGTYFEIDEIQTNIAHGGAVPAAVIDDGSLDPSRSLPQDLFIVSYTGILSDNFFLEGNYSERTFTFADGGGTDSAFRATPVFDLVNGVIFNESIFCESCRPEERDNEQGRAKGTYFLSTESAGAHDMSFGVETFTDIRSAENHQSANDWMIWNFVPSVTTEDDIFPTFLPGGATILTFLPILNPTQGTDFETQSAFYNDAWRLNDALSLSLGVRYDSTDAVNSNGASVADDTSISPRLGVTWTPGGTSPWNLHLYAGRYVGAAANGIFDNSSPAGNPASFYFLFDGAPINAGGPLVDTETAVQRVFDDIFGACPGLTTVQDPDNLTGPPTSLDPVFNCSRNVGGSIPGFNTLLDDGLSPVSTDEITLGFSRPIGNRGLIRADLIAREWSDFFVTRTDLSTGQVTTPDGSEADLNIITNSDVMEREYLGLNITGRLGFLDRRLRIGSAITLSELEGNAAGQTTGSGPVSTGFLQYPQYKEERWNFPTGRLATDQTWKVDAWATYDIFRRSHNTLSVTLFQNFDSGQPYGAVGDVDTRPFVDNPGFVSPPTNVNYFFTDRDAFETDDVTRTDISINYGLNFGRWEFFVQPELFNAFNEDTIARGATANVNTTVFTAVNTGPTSCNGNPCQSFNPFNETPIEGVHWAKGPDFGEPEAEGDLQDTRNWRVSLGVRFNF